MLPLRGKILEGEQPKPEYMMEIDTKISRIVVFRIVNLSLPSFTLVLNPFQLAK